MSDRNDYPEWHQLTAGEKLAVFLVGGILQGVLIGLGLAAAVVAIGLTCRWLS